MTHRESGKRSRLSIQQLEDRRLLAADTFELELVSTGDPTVPAAQIGNDSSLRPDISSDGRYVAFSSFADNLVPGDTNESRDIFVKDLRLGTIERVSVASDGTQGDQSVSSAPPSISGDGRYVAFSSRATNLVANDDNEAPDIFVKDLQTGTLVLASQTIDGTQTPGGAFVASISQDGRYVGYVGDEGVYRKDLQTNELEFVDEGFFEEVSLSADGRYVAYDDDFDVFVKDMDTGDVTLASAAADGTPANDASLFSRISANGRFVAFSSYADNLVASDPNGWTSDIFVKDLVTGDIQLVSSAADGTAGNDDAFRPTLTPDGRFVAFQSYASNLVADDSNSNQADVFVKDLHSGELTLVSTTAEPKLFDRSFSRIDISDDGRYVVFDSLADGHVPGDNNGLLDVFRADLNVEVNPFPGNVTAEVETHPLFGDVLVLTGDDDNNQIRLSSSEPGTVIVEGRSGTTINGMSMTLSFSGIQQIEIELGLGDDVVTGFALNISGGLEVALGDGDDILEILRGHLGALAVDAGLGTDQVVVEATSVYGATDIRMGKGSDVLLLQDSDFEDDVRLDGGLGDDLLTLLANDYFANKLKVKRFESSQ